MKFNNYDSYYFFKALLLLLIDIYYDRVYI